MSDVLGKTPQTPPVDDFAAPAPAAGDARLRERLHREVQEAEQGMRALVEGLDAVFYESDPALAQFSLVSGRAKELLGYSLERWSEPHFWEALIHPDDRADAVRECQAATREERDHSFEYRALAADGRVVWLHDVCCIARDADGRSQGLRGMLIDVSARKRVEQEAAFTGALLQAQGEASVDALLVVSPRGEMLWFNRRFVDVWPIPAQVVADRDDGAALRTVLDKLVDPDAFMARVRELYAARVGPSHDELLLRDGRVLDRHGAPLHADDGAYLGWAWSFRDVTAQKRAEQALVETGERFARLARTLQESLLPPSLPVVPGIQVAARYLPAGGGNEVGGDFYDLFRVGRSDWMAVMGDVCGKGAEAATVTALARYTIRAAAMQSRSPRSMLDQLNRAVLHQIGDERFVTVACARLRRRGERTQLTVASGGHPLPLVRRHDGTVEPIGTAGTLIGAFPRPALADVTAELAPGDALVLYTDGVIEARRDGELFGEERLAALLSGCHDLDAECIATRIEAAVQAFDTAGTRDDTAILVLRAAPSAPT